MRTLYHQLRFTLALLLFLGLAQCGGQKSKSALTNVEIIPDKPIVISADTVAGDKTYKAPWFKFALRITNNSDESITIVAVEATVTSSTGSGTATSKSAFDPSGFNTTVTVSGTDIECKYSSFGTIAPGQTAALEFDNGVTNCPTGQAFFVIGGTQVDESAPNYRFSVRAKPIGWFGSLSEPTDRYDRTITFSTQ